MYVAAQGQPRVSLARTRRHGRRSQVRRTDRWGRELAASCAARLSVEPCAGAGHDR